ncbi:TetR/AcrR family transcriptional regulator [Pontibacter populi]|uniref:TetR/AcrR family transcriptional regulator n=1 Tax=Pontibacter populi TaxID=890055 RepID=A0ABV1RZL3_9BACT
MKTSQVKRDQSINLMVDTALALFSEQGYDVTSIRTIAQRAGISLGLMYNYFKSKEELLVEICRRGTSDVRVSFEQVTPEWQNMSAIERHIRQTVKILKEKKDFWRLIHGIRMQSEVVQRLNAEMKEQTAYIETQIKQNLIEAGIPFPDLEAKLYFASLDGLAQHYLLHENYPIDDVATLLIMKYKR